MQTVIINSNGSRGFSLIEIIFAITLLGVGLLGLATIIPFGIRGVDQSEKRTIATNLVNEGLEQLKAAEFKNLVDTNFPFEDYGEITGYEEYARSYEIRTASDVYSNEIEQLRMATVRVFWRISDTMEHSVYAVTYIGPRYR